MEDQNAQVAVVMVPIPCQSHLNQLLQLSCLISSYGLPVHYVGSATHNRQAKVRSHGLKPKTLATIQFHDLPTPPIASPEPNRNSSDKVPSHIAPATLAYLGLHHPVASLVQELLTKNRRIVIIYDRLVAEAVKDAVLIPNVESYAFNCLSAFNLFCILWESMGKPFSLEEEFIKLPSVKEFYPEPVIQFLFAKPEHFKERDGDIHNTSTLIEAKYLHLLAREEINGSKKLQWAIRPTLLLQNFPTEKQRHKCLEWLDKQAPRSVVYVSFGSVVSLSDEEVRELALGLEQSKKKFIWLLKDADKTDIFAGESHRIELPQGFEERVGEDGIVVRDWAPQMEILAHKSTGGFMSHCGWNSCFESLVAGVPIAAWPMHTDQPLNAVFLAEILKTALIVREWGKREEVVKAAAVKNVVGRLMSSEEGDEIRKRAEEISAAVKESMEEGGNFWREMDNFVAHIKRDK